MKKHKSHHIFIYLGLLVILFLLVITVGYFRGKYQFTEVSGFYKEQSYDEGISVVNPFTRSIVSEQKKYSSWEKVTVGQSHFSYPSEYQLGMDNNGVVYVLPRTTEVMDCKDIVGNIELQDVCNSSNIMSPYISITNELLNSSLPNPFESKAPVVTIGENQWHRFESSSNRETEVVFSRQFDDRLILVSYRFMDSDQGFSLNTLQKYFSGQYRLSSQEQEFLVYDIIESIS